MPSCAPRAASAGKESSASDQPGRPMTSPRLDAASGGQHLRSWMGTQADSRKESSPAFGFGTSVRAVHDKLYTCGGSNKGKGMRLSPGPIYAYRPSIGSGPKHVFGTGAGAGAASAGAAATPRAGHHAPGPGEYTQSDSIGHVHAASLKRTAPAYGWGTDRRPDITKRMPNSGRCGGGGEGGSGPSVFYDMHDSIGAQPQSTKKGASTTVFGTQQRFSGACRSTCANVE